MTESSRPGRWARMGIRGKILAVGAAGMAAAIAVGGFAITGLHGAGESLDEVNALNEALGQAQSMEYYNADVSGWQVTYAWDARRFGGAAAVRPDSENRAGFLEIGESLREELDNMPREVLTAEETQVYDRIVARWGDFFAIDEDIVALYAQGTPASMDAAEELMLGDSWAVYYEIIELTHDLKESLAARAD